MGKRSTKENKNAYQKAREKLYSSREAAAADLNISVSRIERIEGDQKPRPDEVLSMARVYNDPSLCNEYCCNWCEIGQCHAPKIDMSKGLSQITIEMLSVLNALSKEKERLIEIVVDGKITEDELPDFLVIQKRLDEMALIINSLKLWFEKNVTTLERP